MTNSTKEPLITSVINETIELLPKTFKLCWKEVLLVFILLEPFSLYFQNLQKMFTDHPQGQVISSLGIFMVSLTIGIILIFLIPLRAHEAANNIPKRGVFSFAGEHAIAFIFEGLKMFGIVLIGFLFFIIPGLYLYYRYMFNPFVIMFDEDYYKKEKSAIKESYEITRGNVFFIFLITLITGILTYITEVFSNSFNLFESFNPLWLVAFALNMGAQLLSYTCLYVIYRQLQSRRNPADTIQEGQNEINVQME